MTCGAPPRGSLIRDPKAALLQDAMEAARALKRKHRAYYAQDQKGFRALVRKAHARVFRLKPGPKTNIRIAKAARKRAAGAKWADLYPKYIEHYRSMPEFTKELAESGFQRKVTAYLQRHPRLRRKPR